MGVGVFSFVITNLLSKKAAFIGIVRTVRFGVRTVNTYKKGGHQDDLLSQKAIKYLL